MSIQKCQAADTIQLHITLWPFRVLLHRICVFGPVDRQVYLKQKEFILSRKKSLNLVVNLSPSGLPNREESGVNNFV